MLKFINQTRSQWQRFVSNVSKACENQSSQYETKIIDLPLGKISGKKQCSLYGHEYYSFEGIPYGQPPLGPWRFKLPQKAQPWNDVLDCQNEREPPVQIDLSTGLAIGSEDCLYLNVYSKHFDSTKPPLPVMVYIYGGAFRTGGAIRAKYGPDYLMEKEIVYVLFNYRLCSLGFLSLADAQLEVPGNAGLHDQLLALHWIQQNICHFNGDPENITLFGQSAGAASVHFMMCLPQACNLFHKAIMMSGSILSPWTQAPEPETLGCRLALQTGFEGYLKENCLLKHLQMLPPHCLVQHNMYSIYERCFGFLHPFGPTVEPYETEKTLIGKSYLQLMGDAWSSQVPLLLGGTSFEGLIMYPYCKLCNGFILDLLKQQTSLVLPYELFKIMSPEQRKCYVEQLVRFHYGPRQMHKNNVTQLLDLFSYKLFWHGLHRVVRSRLALAQAPTYLYRFDFDSPTFNFMRIKLCGNDIKRGVCHADDLGYVFHKQGVAQLPPESPELKTIKRMVAMLTAFAYTGDPNCEETGPDKWLPVSPKQSFKAMNISHQMEFVTQAEREGLEVWNQMYGKDLY